MPSILVFKIACCLFVERGQIPLDKRISSSAQDMIWTLKLDEEKSKCAVLAQENGFGSAFLHSLRWLVKGTITVGVHLQKKECNKYDVTAAQCF